MTAVTYLRKARLDAGMSLQAVAEQTGIQVGNLSRIERGQMNPTAPTLVKLFRLYGLDHIADLMDPAVTVLVPA